MKDIQQLKTLGDLKAVGYNSKSIKDELRDNLILKMKSWRNSFRRYTRV